MNLYKMKPLRKVYCHGRDFSYEAYKEMTGGELDQDILDKIEQNKLYQFDNSMYFQTNMHKIRKAVEGLVEGNCLVNYHSRKKFAAESMGISMRAGTKELVPLSNEAWSEAISRIRTYRTLMKDLLDYEMPENTFLNLEYEGMNVGKAFRYMNREDLLDT